jgi:hypothetical protein
MRSGLLLLCFFLALPARPDESHDSSPPDDSGVASVAAPTDRCPAWAREKGGAPPCPKGSQVLPDTFPALAHVVSDDFNPHYGNWPPNPNIPYWTEIKSKMALEFTMNALQTSDPKTPLFFLPVHDDTFALIRSAVEAQTAADPEKRKRWLGSLIHMKGPAFVYLQDPMKAVRGKEPGTVEIRPIPAHLAAKAGETFRVETFTAEAQKICPLIRPGAPIELASGEKYGDGHAGGNIVGLPGGLVTHGANQRPEFTAQYSGGRENEVDVDTSWLYVGHADEVLNTIANPSEKEPCDFAIAIASVRKAMELLSDESRKNDPFIEGAPGSKVVTQEKETAYRTEFSLWWLCNPLSDYEDELRKTAGKPRMTPDENKAFINACYQKKTGEVAQTIKDFPQFSVTYELVQKRIDAVQAVVKKRIEEKLPACKDKVKFVEVPVLYQPMYKPIPLKGSKPDDPIEKRFALAKSAVRAWLPNLVNGVPSGRSLISPFPHSKAFREYMQKTFKKMGAENPYADDYYYAHMGSGNVHCATHTMRLCQ